MGSSASKEGDGEPLPKVPIVYSPGYNVSFLGLEKLHPFDSCKYGRIFLHLCSSLHLHASQFHEPTEPMTREELLDVHTPEYLDSLESSSAVAALCELAPLALLPHSLIKSRILLPMLLAVRGTLMAAELALAHGHAINLGGGMHHASGDQGGGWCVFSDIILAYRHVRRGHPGLKMLIIDLDVHQGNGHERDKLRLHPEDIYIIDAYNPKIYPGDSTARKAIDSSVLLLPETTEESYLQDVEAALRGGISYFKPGLIAYNAGSDVLLGDPLNGGVGITADALVKRDELVMRVAKETGTPIFMVLSGGYARENAAVVGRSLQNLIERLILLPEGSVVAEKEEEEGIAAAVKKTVKRKAGKEPDCKHADDD